MKRVLLLSLALLLALMLLPTVSMAAPGKNKKDPELRTVTFEDPDITGTDELQILEWGSNLRFYTPIGEKTSLTFVGEPLWHVTPTLNFTGRHKGKLGITIDKGTGKATIDYTFGTQDVTVTRKGKEKIVTYPLWRLTGTAGPGSYTSGEEPNTGILSVDSEAFEIYEIVPHVKANGAIGLEFVGPVWKGTLTFTVSITEIAE